MYISEYLHEIKNILFEINTGQANQNILRAMSLLEIP